MIKMIVPKGVKLAKPYGVDRNPPQTPSTPAHFFPLEYSPHIRNFGNMLLEEKLTDEQAVAAGPMVGSVTEK